MPGESIEAELFEREISEDGTHAIILTRWLDQLGIDVTITAVGTPAIKSGPDAALVMANESVNASAYVSLRTGVSHPAGHVIFVDFSAGTAGKQYDVKIPFTITGGATRVVIQPVYVV